MNRILYVIADGGRARFVERTEAGAFRTIRSVESTDIHAGRRDLRRAATDRRPENAEPTQHSIAPRVDDRDKAEEIFIRLVAGTLDNDGAARTAESIVLVLPSRLLKSFWSAMGPETAAKVRRTFSKNLTRVPDSDLERHLPVVLPKSEAGSGGPW